MEHSATFARLFARLVSLLIHEGENVDEQKMALRAVVAIGKQGAVRLRANGGTLYADGEPMAEVLPGVREVAARMNAGQLSEIEFERQPAAGSTRSVRTSRHSTWRSKGWAQRRCAS